MGPDEGPDYAGLADDAAIDFAEEALELPDDLPGDLPDDLPHVGILNEDDAALGHDALADDAFSELDAALAAEEPETPREESRRGLFRRRL